ncbi:hypothetical protein N7462_011368 [Penicillium macrosclerotiorum]|uniref:uncharacterized protein n=1 Tax=Penicillium macrosclerotiorum TaxID=303699 RepID=UPI002549789F|nr:uncharacterized protein N7462_011368 [Penicillium macrosclerotiorum]KAJ5666959.1 hypothetical protein N7462_011368 [Penicillium macrosclerotiorum]
MATPQGSSHSALKTSLPSAFAAANADQPASHLPSQEEQEKYLPGRPAATPRHLGIALQHAHQIQAQKDAEDMILDRIIDLLTLPSSPSANPAAPSPADTQAFKSAIVHFTPKNYDNLITERNFEGLCGYTLCPQEHRTNGGTNQAFSFKWGAKGSGPGGRGRSMDIVPQEQLAKWCSDECAERALFIRVQLAEEPVWGRRAADTDAIKIELLEESRAHQRKLKAGSSSTAAVAASLRDLKIQDPERARELAMERGDTSLPLRQGRVDVQIKEKEHNVQSTARAPQMRAEDAMGGSIEGYVPQKPQGQKSVDYDNNGDVLGQI